MELHIIVGNNLKEKNHGKILFKIVSKKDGGQHTTFFPIFTLQKI